MEKVRDMRKHVSLVAGLHIGFAVLGLVVALIIFLSINFAQSFVAGEDIAESVLYAVKIIIPSLIALISIFSIVGGIGLLSYHEWARVLLIVVSAINCLNVPIGTAKGVYSMWALLQDDTIKLFRVEKPAAPVQTFQ